MRIVYVIMFAKQPLVDSTTQCGILGVYDDADVAADSLEMYIRQTESAGYKFHYQSENGFEDEVYYEQIYHFKKWDGTQSVIKLVKTYLP